MQRALRSLPVPRARRGEGLPAVSPQGDAFGFRCCEAFLSVLSVLTVLGGERRSRGERAGDEAVLLFAAWTLVCESS